MPEAVIDKTVTDTTKPAGSTTQQTDTTKPAGSTTADTTPKFTYSEDRSSWVKPTDHAKALEDRKRFEREVAATTARAEDLDRKLKAMAGVSTPTPEQKFAKETLDSFLALPGAEHFSRLTPALLDRVEKLLEREAEISDTVETQKAALANFYLRGIETKLTDLLGSDELTDDQRDDIPALFAGWLRRNAETLGPRYKAQDPTLIDEFAKRFEANFVVPSRRLKAAETVARPRVPNGGRSQPVITSATKKKPDPKDFTKDGEFNRDAYLKAVVEAASDAAHAAAS